MLQTQQQLQLKDSIFRHTTQETAKQFHVKIRNRLNNYLSNENSKKIFKYIKNLLSLKHHL